jgi:hypothetical protein
MLPLAQLMPPGLTCDSTDVIEKTIPMTTAAASFTISDRSAGSVIAYIAFDVPNTLSASTAVKWSIGITSDPDLYYLSAALTASSGQKCLLYLDSNITATETIKVFAVDTNGAAAGTIGGGADDSVSIRIGWIKVEAV